MIQRYFKEIGFTEGEEKVYFALLKLGSSTSGAIAKEGEVSRSKLYEILEKLARKGIISHYKKNNITYFRAAPPTRIIDYLDKKKELLEQQKKSFERNLPLFEELIGQKEIAKEAEVYEGREGIKSVREEALCRMKPNDIMYYFGNPISGHQRLLGYWDDWNRRRIKKKISAWIIYNQDAKFYGERRKKLKYTKVKYLPQKGPSHAWIEIYGDVIAIAIEYMTPMSIVIRNKFIAQSFLTFFKCLWSVALDKV